MIQEIVIAGLAAAYSIFIFRAKNGPGTLFLKARQHIARKNIPFLSKHLLCPTCLALSVGAAAYFAIRSPLAILVHIFAVAGTICVLHGMMGYWHDRDE